MDDQSDKMHRHAHNSLPEGQINDLFSTKMLSTLSTQRGLGGRERSWIESLSFFFFNGSWNNVVVIQPEFGPLMSFRLNANIRLIDLPGNV